MNNSCELKIVAVLDWEWAYAAPFQMLYSPPRWLMIKKPLSWELEDAQRYHTLFETFVKILAEEENKRADIRHEPSMASLMEESMNDGKFWFHELVYSCFESPDNRAWNAILERFPNLELETDIPNMDLFVRAKMKQLGQYTEQWKVMKQEIDKKEAEFQAKKAMIENL